jgi:hypothetical protein
VLRAVSGFDVCWSSMNNVNYKRWIKCLTKKVCYASA